MIECEQVVKTYALGQRRVTALNGINLQVREGEFVAVVGPSGCGKSTLLNLMGCLDVPTEGRVKILDQETTLLTDTQQSELRNQFLGFIFQSFNLIPVLTTSENIQYPLLLQNLSWSERKQRVDELLEQVGLAQHREHRPDHLSGGQRQRVAIARALVTRPKLVLADEPTANLDSKTGTEILDLMKSINRSLGTSFIFSTHDSKVSEYASKIFMLKDGMLIT